MRCLEPVSFEKFRTVNRFVRSATCEYLADENGQPGEGFVKLYEGLARGNIGIVITGYAYVLPNGKSNPGQAGIYSDALIPAWQKVTEVFRNSDSLFLMQIVHGGRQVRTKNNPRPIWAPSAVPDTVFKTHPKEMTESQIREIIMAFVNAAKRAEIAGFSGIQLHLAHGYLLSQFISSYTNRRQDDYGGSQEKRTRIVLEIISGIKKVVSDKFIISAKINGEDFIKGGLSIDQAILSAELMKKAGLDLVEVSGGIAEGKMATVRKNIINIEQEGYFIKQAQIIRRQVGLPTASVGGFRTLSFIEDIIVSGRIDFISMCRPFIREPQIINEFRKNTLEKAACVSCNRCFNPRGLQCWQLANGA